MLSHVYSYVFYLSVSGSNHFQPSEPYFDPSKIDGWVLFLLLRLNIVNWTDKNKRKLSRQFWVHLWRMSSER